MASLSVWVDSRRVGEFTEQPVAEGSLFVFEYLRDATVADLVSLTMVPFGDARRFETRVFPPPFDMILPEGDRRARIEAARKIVPSDPFSLLSYVGANPVNRVRFLATDAAAKDPLPELPTPREIAGCASGQALFRRLINEVDLRQGIAGVQPKILGRARPYGPAKRPAKFSLDARQYRGSTHILKTSTSNFPFLAVNEELCLKVFEAAGLAIPKTTLSADGELLLVERFDLLPEGDHLGFEEAAALMGETSQTKYQRDYGSLIESLAALVPPQQEESVRADLTKAVILNWLLGNGDAHLKNFGVLYRDDLDVRLAPFYDCVSTLVYLPDDVPALALSFEWYSKAWWPRAKVKAFAESYGRLKPGQVEEVIEECRAAVAHGVKLARRYGRQIPRFADLGSEMAKFWNQRVTELAPP